MVTKTIVFTIRFTNNWVDKFLTSQYRIEGYTGLASDTIYFEYRSIPVYHFEFTVIFYYFIQYTKLYF